MNGHPAWCNPARCELSLQGAHSSMPIKIPFDARGVSIARIRIWQRPDQVEPFVEIAVSNVGGKNCRADFTVRQARDINVAITSVLIKIGDVE